MPQSVVAVAGGSDSWWFTSLRSVAFVLGLAMVFCGLFANRPLWHTDLWDHANYGNFILKNGLPETEPLIPLSEGAPFVATAWMSQVSMAVLLHQPFGLSALQFAHGVLVVIAMIAVGGAVFGRNGSIAFSILAYCVFLGVNWQQLIIIRPQMAGVTCFCIVAASVSSRLACERRRQIFLPLLFVLWVNCHGSFAIGLAVIGLTAAGRFLDVFCQNRQANSLSVFRCSIADRKCQCLLLLLVSCTLASCVNPYGVSIFREVVRVGSHPNISSMFEWLPMSLHMKQGKMMAASVAILAVLFCLTPHKMMFEECMRLLLTAVLAVWSARMINWFAAVAAISIGIHGHAVWCRFRNRCADSQLPDTQQPVMSGKWTAVNVAVVGLAVIFTPLGQQAFGIQEFEVRDSVSRQTPVELAAFLAKQDHLSDDLIFVPAEWTGYLMHAAADKIQPLVNLHVHVMPQEIWFDYVAIVSNPDAVESTLNKYEIDTVATDKFRQGRLIRTLDESAEFHRWYEDHQSIVFRRQ